MSDVLDHTAGRTVAHRSPFEHLIVPNRREHPVHLAARWVRPFYMTAPEHPSFGERYRAQRVEATSALAGELLSYFDWRPKAVGAYLVAIERHESQRELVGRLLLRSDVCCCGDAFCLALARLGGEESARVLRDYLDHYLSRPDLAFDQAAALAALTSLDAREGSLHARDYEARWSHYAASRPSPLPASHLADVCTRLETSLRALEALGS